MHPCGAVRGPPAGFSLVASSWPRWRCSGLVPGETGCVSSEGFLRVEQNRKPGESLWDDFP